MRQATADGFGSAQLSALRSMAEGFMTAPVVVLEPTIGSGQFSDGTTTTITATRLNAHIEQPFRQPKAMAEVTVGVHEVVDYLVSVTYSSTVSKKAVILTQDGTWIGVYSGATNYSTGDLVFYKGKYWKAKTSTTGTAPTEGATWTQVQSVEVLGTNCQNPNRVRTICACKEI